MTHRDLPQARGAATKRLSEEQRAKLRETMSRPDVKSRRIASLRAGNEQRKGPRFLVDENGCWLWQWADNGKGYPSPGVRRAVYEHEVGGYPGNWALHHHCNQRRCVNPEHALPMTRARHILLHRELKQLGYGEMTVAERIDLSVRVCSEVLEEVIAAACMR